MAQAGLLGTPIAATAPAKTVDYPASSVAFDWTMAVLTVVLMGGVIQDGWAHAHGMVDQSFLTPWHAVLYSMMAVNGIVLGALAVRNRLAGYPVRRALPYGYTLALIGVVLFALAGVFDLWWHTLFGIENGITGLISPSHLVLALSGMLVFSGPIRSIARQYGRDASGWRRVGPAALGLLASLTMLGFFTGYAQPIEDGITMKTIALDQTGAVVAGLYAAGGAGTTLTRLYVPSKLDIWGVTASPDGRSIAYRAQAPQSTQSGSEPTSDLYVARPDGTDPVRITHSGRHDTEPAWSPDGKWLAYISLPAGTSGNFSLHVVRSNGRDDRTLVDGTTTLSTPAWSPDGKQIAYGSRNGLDQEIAIVDAGGGTPRWLTFTKGANDALWSGGRIAFEGDDAELRSTTIAGADLRVVAKNASSPAISPDGRYLAYLAPGSGGTQVFVANADGSKSHDVSALSGLDAAHPAWDGNGRLFFTATGRALPERTFVGLSLAEAANLLQAVLLAGVLLLAVRRWRVPFGTFTVVLTLFALAMAAQTDAYYDAVGALLTGLLADAALAFFGDRLRSGAGFYAFAFLLPAVFFATYLIATIVTSGAGTAWEPNMWLGSPLLAGIAGLLVAFCYQPPLPEAVAAAA
jgi:Tol biopolymer transport system component